MSILWKASDGWRDFKGLFESHANLTLVTENGTRHFFDMEDSLFMRLPGSLVFNPLDKDNEWTNLDGIVTATACGFVFFKSMTSYRLTSRCVLLYDKFVPEPPTTEFSENKPFVEEYPDHPEGRCGANYCTNRNLAAKMS